MSAPEEIRVHAGGVSCRVWRKGEGEPVVFLPGVGGLPKWPAFLDELAQTHEVFAVSPPGFPGSGPANELLTIVDWALAVDDIVRTLGLSKPFLVGASVGGALAAELASLWPEKFRKLALISPLGAFDEAEPTADVWAQRPGREGELLCAEPPNYAGLIDAPEDADVVEWKVTQVRADSTAARFLWPLGDTGVLARLRRWTGPTLLIRGADDKVLPRSYLGRFAEALGAKPDLSEIEGAGHLVYLDQPTTCAGAIRDFAT